RGRSRAELAQVSSADALAHPTWSMGPKITIDSATLMNKGLEAIEAHHLFGVAYERIKIVIHPESCVHSMVEFADGSVKAHLGATDMRIPIQYAFSHPERWGAPVTPVDFTTLAGLHFEAPDLDTFGCLGLALSAGREGGSMPAAMNAANEIAVAAFLEGRCGFLDIERTVAAVMEAHDTRPLESIEQIEHADAEAREMARSLLAKAS
ncbi:MAG: 1-deoxy-D-xylulose-5-phosphate reductoisomerase, partial [Coriobacteriia bacterium]|nr:1-deoxy-D-xylulose-5-phosphate reductoisomerase [Coriobacteriia bacterium]